MTPLPEKRGRERTSKSSSSPSSKLKNHTFMLLDLRPGAGNMLGPCWEYDPVWLGSLGTLNTSECPSDVVESSLSQILLDTAPSKYYSSQTACRGILRRSEGRGKELPKKLKAALMIQAGLCSLDELWELNAEADSDSSDGQGTENTKFSAGFSAGAGSSAGSIAYSEQIAPTLKGSASGNCMPSVLCLNDQSGSIMECSENISGTLRAQEHGHQPLVLSEGPALYEKSWDRRQVQRPPLRCPHSPSPGGTGGKQSQPSGAAKAGARPGGFMPAPDPMRFGRPIQRGLRAPGRAKTPPT